MSNDTNTAGYAKGLEGVVAAHTRLSDVRGDIGQLIYCGYDINELAGKVKQGAAVAVRTAGAAKAVASKGTAAKAQTAPAATPVSPSKPAAAKKRWYEPHCSKPNGEFVRLPWSTRSYHANPVMSWSLEKLSRHSSRWSKNRSLARTN